MEDEFRPSVPSFPCIIIENDVNEISTEINIIYLASMT